MESIKPIIITTGGTGGHIFPALALKKILEEQGKKVKLTADSRFTRYQPFDDSHIFIPAENLASKSIFKLMKSLACLAHGFLKSLCLIYREKPSMVIGFGGYATYPMLLAAVIFGKKIILHEANTVIGKVNRLLLCRAKYITTGFKTLYGVASRYQDKIVYTGNPVREDILKSKPNKIKDKLSILVIGGSQGAKIFSKIVPEVIINLPAEIKAKLHICQQVKEEDVDLITALYTNQGITCEIKSFFNNMAQQFGQANLVIARSGASTIAELIATKLPAILIPLPNSADNHQFYNAKEMDDLSAAWLIEEGPKAKNNMLRIIKSIGQDSQKIEKRISKLESLQQDACENIIRIIDIVEMAE